MNTLKITTLFRQAKDFEFLAKLMFIDGTEYNADEFYKKLSELCNSRSLLNKDLDRTIEHVIDKKENIITYSEIWTFKELEQ